MILLSQTETEFRRALRAPDLPVPDGLQDGAARAAGRRFNVYRNNVAVGLLSALEEAFPTLLGLLGPDNFRGVARAFMADHPPTSPVMMLYGAEFPAFLAAFPPLAHLPYLSDVARIDQAMRESYHAADHTPLTGAALAAVAPEALADLTLCLAPSLRLIRSPWPIHAIWAYTTLPDQPKPQAGAQDVAILRAEFDPEPHLLPPGGAVFLTVLTACGTLGAATEAAETIAPDFDLPALLTLLLTQNALCALPE